MADVTLLTNKFVRDVGTDELEECRVVLAARLHRCRVDAVFKARRHGSKGRCSVRID